MTTDHSSYDDLARERRDSAEYREGYAEAQRAFLIGQAVRERRLTLGLSQTELATRAGMTQPALSRLEAGGVIPTIPLLERISAALDADLIVQISPHAAWYVTSPSAIASGHGRGVSLDPQRRRSARTRM
jgi:transcriptional regulator with XRE-family HTH domain